MKVNAELYVRDLPGQLVGSLEPISMVSGNIMGVVHDRGQKVGDRILMSVTFEVKTPAQLEELKDLWKSMDVQIGRVGNAEKTYAMDYIIIGDLSGSAVDSILEDASKTVDLCSVSVGYSYGADRSKRSAIISTELRSRMDIAKLDAFFAGICEKNNMVLVKGGIL